MKRNKAELFISPEITIKEALKKLNKSAEKVLILVDENECLKGCLTDGDLRRAMLDGKNLDNSIKGLFNNAPKYFYEGEYSKSDLEEIFFVHKIELIPIVNKQKKVVNYEVWNDFLNDDKAAKAAKDKLNIPVIVMAGGKGTRLAPFTRILPKPLIPIDEKPVLEHIVDYYVTEGVSDFIFTLNHKGEMIRAYFNGIEKKYNVNYVIEKEFLGTASCLTLAVDILPDVFIVSNCDIFVKANYSEIIDFHKKNNADLTVISSVNHHVIPYGVIENGPGGVVKRINEKPEFTQLINTGVYVLNKSCLSHIPEGEFFHMTHLIDKLMKIGKCVLTYPVNEDDYIDIGQWEEYRAATNKLERIFH